MSDADEKLRALAEHEALRQRFLAQGNPATDPYFAAADLPVPEEK